MNNENELIKLARLRRQQGYTIWPIKCSKCGVKKEKGRLVKVGINIHHVISGGNVQQFCDECFAKSEFSQPERLNPEASKEDAIV